MNIFQVQDCAVITRMAGVTSAVNLRELRERVSGCSIASLYHHFCETVIRSSFDYPVFRNDFAVWAFRSLRDTVLAERLGIINPYAFSDFEKLREQIIEIIEDRLHEVSFVPWAPRGEEFYFMMGSTVIFQTDLVIHTPQELMDGLSQMTLGSVYFHFVEARRRTPGRTDDFSEWLSPFEEYRGLIDAFQSLDFYFFTLKELKALLVETLQSFQGSLAPR